MAAARLLYSGRRGGEASSRASGWTNRRGSKGELSRCQSSPGMCCLVRAQPRVVCILASRAADRREGLRQARFSSSKRMPASRLGSPWLAARRLESARGTRGYRFRNTAAAAILASARRHLAHARFRFPSPDPGRRPSRRSEQGHRWSELDGR